MSNTNGKIHIEYDFGSDNSNCETPLPDDKPHKPTEREQWRGKLDFLIACMGFSIGLGNVWRFPYLCYKNGGGAFLIPYFISVFLAGIPLFLLEVTMGQLISRGAIAAWNICPLFQGVGCASTLINFLVNTYYTVILGWAFHFLFSSCTHTLPWVDCDHYWNTPACQSAVNYSEALTGKSVNYTGVSIDPATEYWENRVLGLSDGIDQVGTVRWDLALCLLLAWTIIFLCIFQGIKTSGKIMYVTATAPYVFMTILLIRTSLLEGARDGISYYLKPDWSKLSDMTVWSDAGTQIFFSYALGLGALTALGSFNKYHHNSFRDCLLFAGMNTFTSLMAGFVIFATLGNMAYTSNIPIDSVAESGPGLAFVIYPRALGTMPGSPFWSVCFFVMVILLGIDSMFGGVEGFVTAIADYFPRITETKRNRGLFVGVVCLVSYLLGLSMVTNGGMYVFQLFDYYSGSRIILIVGFLESIAIGFIYGARRMTKNMKSMYGLDLKWFPTIIWCITTPIFTLALFVFSVVIYEELSYKRASRPEPYQFPRWAVTLGWLMASCSIFLIPIVMIVQLIRTPGSIKERFKALCEPQVSDMVRQRLEYMSDTTLDESYKHNVNNHLDSPDPAQLR